MDNNIFAFSATETGYNHLKVDKGCEDASDFYDDERMHICVVADGHGSDNYPRTDRGSKKAVDVAIQCVIDFVKMADVADVLEDEKNNYELLLQLAKSILRAWYQALEEDYEQHPFTEEELEKVSDKYRQYYLAKNNTERRIEKAYGCTLIVFAVTERYSFGMQIGDGMCVVVDREGNFREPIPWDEDCQLNVTTSICDSDAIDEFRFYVTDKDPVAVFCGSDGIDDSYSGREELYAFYRSILTIFIEHGRDVGESEIKEYLPILTKRGSGDDVSVGVIINVSAATAIAPVFKLQNEAFTLQEEEKNVRHMMDVTQEKKKLLASKIQKLAEGKQVVSAEDDAVIQIKQINEDCRNYSKRQEEIKKRLAEIEGDKQSVLYDRDYLSFTNNSETEATTVVEDSNNRAVEISLIADEKESVEESGVPLEET